MKRYKLLVGPGWANIWFSGSLVRPPTNEEITELKQFVADHPFVEVYLHQTHGMGCNWVRLLADLPGVRIYGMSDAIQSTAKSIGVIDKLDLWSIDDHPDCA